MDSQGKGSVNRVATTTSIQVPIVSMEVRTVEAITTVQAIHRTIIPRREETIMAVMVVTVGMVVAIGVQVTERL